MLNVAAIHEAIAGAIPDSECLVFGDRRFTWVEQRERTRRLADVLLRAGLGCRQPRADLANWESGQDHIALYLYNGNEYLEGMVGAYKARCAPFNVNYRYVESELAYLFDNADARAVIFHAGFAPLLERIRGSLPQVELWLEVEDGSGEHLSGAVGYEEALAAASPTPPKGLSPDDLYILYTGGTTGLPKGVLWRQEEIVQAALTPPRVRPDLEAIVERARRHPGQVRALPIPPFMHGASHWSALTIWHTGGTVCIQSDPMRLDPADVWATVDRERITTMTIVGDAFAQPLLEELTKGDYDVTSLNTVTSGGAILSASVKAELLARLPGARILDILGSSESGHQASQITRAGEAPRTGDFDLGAGTALLKEDLSGLVAPGSGESGWLARRGPLPLGYYKDEDKTARTFPVVDGIRYSVPGDRAVALPGGGLQLLGRDSVTINSGGEKIFAEEVEQAIKQHPAVYDTVVTGTPHPRWGQQVTAIVSLRPGTTVGAEEIRTECARHLARFKCPREFVFVDRVLRAPSGKADYRWAKATAEQHLVADA